MGPNLRYRAHAITRRSSSTGSVHAERLQSYDGRGSAGTFILYVDFSLN